MLHFATSIFPPRHVCFKRVPNAARPKAATTSAPPQGRRVQERAIDRAIFAALWLDYGIAVWNGRRLFISQARFWNGWEGRLKYICRTCLPIASSVYPFHAFAKPIYSSNPIKTPIGTNDKQTVLQSTRERGCGRLFLIDARPRTPSILRKECR
jgi:hypothetical protein